MAKSLRTISPNFSSRRTQTFGQPAGTIFRPRAVAENLVRKHETAFVGGDNLIMEILTKDNTIY
jgi:hypothetical protein